VPVIVILYAPVGVEEDTEIVIVDVNVGVPEDGLKVTDAPDGRPEADRLTMPLKPLMDETETVAVTDPPRFTDLDAGLTLIVKSFTLVFLSFIAAMLS
jgi:hypothetical protein